MKRESVRLRWHLIKQQLSVLYAVLRIKLQCVFNRAAFSLMEVTDQCL